MTKENSPICPTMRPQPTALRGLTPPSRKAKAAIAAFSATEAKSAAAITARLSNTTATSNCKPIEAKITPLVALGLAARKPTTSRWLRSPRASRERPYAPGWNDSAALQRRGHHQGLAISISAVARMRSMTVRPKPVANRSLIQKNDNTDAN